MPVQGFGMFGMIEGAPEFRAYMRRHAGRDIAPKGARKIYISRSALPPGRGSILGEARLEAWLEAEGYEVVLMEYKRGISLGVLGRDADQGAHSACTPRCSPTRSSPPPRLPLLRPGDVLG